MNRKISTSTIFFCVFFLFIRLSIQNPDAIGVISDQAAELFTPFAFDIPYEMFYGDEGHPYSVKLESPLPWLMIEVDPEYVGGLFKSVDEVRDVFVVGDVLFVLTRENLLILNITNMEPRLISSIEVPSQGHSLFVEGDYAFISTVENDGIMAVNIQDLTDPSHTWTSSFALFSRGLAVKDGHLFAANPDGIIYYSVYELPGTPNGATLTRVKNAYDILVSSNDLIYVSCVLGYNPGSKFITGIVIIEPNVGAFASSEIVGYSTLAVGDIFLDEENMLLYVADHSELIYGSGIPHQGLSILNVTDPGNITRVEQTRVHGDDDALSVVGHDDVAYVGVLGGIVSLPVGGSNVDSGSVVLEGGDDSSRKDGKSISWMNLEFAGDIPVALSMDQSGDFLIIAARKSGIVILDVSTNGTMLFYSQYSISNIRYNDIKISGDYAYLCCHRSLKVVDISDPADPFQVGAFLDPLMQCSSLKIQSEYLYVGGMKMIVLDISDPFHPLEMLRFPFTNLTEEAIQCVDIDVLGDFVYCANPLRGVVNIMYINDILNRNTIMNYEIDEPSDPSQIAVDVAYIDGEERTLLYVAGGLSGLRVYDVTDLVSIQAVSELSFNGNQVETVRLQGNYSYFTLGSGENFDLKIIDVRDPLNLAFSDIVSSVYVNNPFEDHGRTNVNDDFIFISSLTGIDILDIRNRHNPNKIGSIETSNGSFLAIASKGQFIFAGTDEENDGFTVYRQKSIITGTPTSSDSCGSHDVAIFARDINGRSEKITFAMHVRGSEDFIDPENCVFFCNEVMSNSSDVCSSHGDCTDGPNGTCECYPGYFGNNCEVYKCYGHYSNDSSKVCQGHGKCVDMSTEVDLGRFQCNCSANFSGHDCWRHYCYGVAANSTSVCSGHGTCAENGECAPCDEYYFGKYCNFTTCDGILFNDTKYVCHAHGDCNIETRKCECTNSSYTGDFCQNWECQNTLNSERYVCGGHGDCIDMDICKCDSSIYGGKFCDLWSCHSINVLDPEVCGSHGVCLDQDKCFCFSGYKAAVIFGNCTLFDCGEFGKEEAGVCNNRGTCVSSHMCKCEDDFEGDLCDSWSCGYKHDHQQTCSGHGKCVKPNTCECKSGHVDALCSTNLILPLILGPTMSVAALLVSLIILSILCCCCCLFCIVAIAILSLVAVGAVQNFKNSRYGKLRNFDVLLKEQELEDDVTIAHLRMNNSLFEIDLDDVKIVELLGEGGSNSTVFKATWCGKIVAFKAFKTRLICSSQEKFDEFEREVEVLASVSHPNIIQFFGATVRKPRIGIVMEFCVNGDLVKYLTGEGRKSRGQSSCLSLRKKMVMLLEVASSMDYLHSRGIIHRDLKLENVLVDKFGSCKLMDFGLSTIVERMSQVKTTRIGTNLYMAPEVLNQNQYTEKCDVFSFSIFIYIFITEIYEPYGVKENIHLEIKVSSDPTFRPQLKNFQRLKMKQKKKKQNEKEVFDFLEEVMVNCWQHDANDRYGFEELSKLFKDKIDQVWGTEKKNNDDDDADDCGMILCFGDGNEEEEDMENVEKEEEMKKAEEELSLIREEYFRMKKEIFKIMKMLN